MKGNCQQRGKICRHLHFLMVHITLITVREEFALCL
ncbi:unnamed protein product [Onchocerca flexuosa]|uniref:Uncharacterized protein n=1 Tax=Onchocerca flexuosa TaxID=387005 RepID=A0A183HSK2_9BILA|nr:unnamed protein product [Onchocerca flexuosa]